MSGEVRVEVDGSLYISLTTGTSMWQ